MTYARADSGRGHPDEPVPSDKAGQVIFDQIVRLIGDLFPWTHAVAMMVGSRLNEDLGLDSLHMVELQVALEDQFCVMFDPEDDEFLDALNTIGSMDAYIRHLLESRAS